jgi:hypothetical protein
MAQGVIAARRFSTAPSDRSVSMLFDIYGRFRIEVLRVGERWNVYRPGLGAHVPMFEVSIPPELDQVELDAFLDDLYHELGGPGLVVRQVEAGA